ncbi:YhgE/Pip domain-containing protein [Actinomycetaceae bacterium L2_0104]
MSLQPASRLLRYEFRRFKGRSRIALVFILLIPILYGGIYLHANWDLYGHIDSIKVAVVNHDEPTTFQDKEISGGELFEEALHDNPTFDWQFLGQDDAKAQEGLSNGEYFMVIEVPKDFSKNLVSAGSFRPARATITLHRDDANGFIIGTLTGKAEDALSKTLDATISEAYFKALFVNIDGMKGKLTEAADGSQQLDSGLSQAADGVKQLNDAVTNVDASGLQQKLDSVDAGISGVDSGLHALMDAAGTMRQGVGEMTGIGTTVSNGATNVRNALAPVTDFFENRLPSLQGDAVELADLNASLVGGADSGLVVDLGGNLSAASRLTGNLLADHPELADDPNYTSLVNELSLASEVHADVQGKVTAQATLTAGLKVNLDPTLLQASGDAAKAAADTLDQAAATLSSGSAKVSEGLDEADAAMATLNGGIDTLRVATTDFMAEAPELVNGVLQLTNAIGQLNTAMPQLSDGAHTLAAGLADGVKQIPSLSDDQQDSLSSVMSSPVDIQQNVSHDAEFYGRGLAPMFFSIALWIACVSIFLVVRTISGRALTGRASALRTAFFGYGPVAVVAVLGALIMGFGVWLLLGLDPVHPWLFTLLLIVAALAFTALAYVVRLVFGSPQTAVFLVALILQLPASGGTFPVAMLTPFYQAVAVISPLRYSVDAFRVVISGGNLAVFWGSTAVLAGILAVSLLLIWRLVHRRKVFSMRDLHPPMVTSNTTADYAFSVRPR